VHTHPAVQKTIELSSSLAQISTKNIFKTWQISSRHATTVNPPRFTTQSPQLHHKNTTQKQHFSQTPFKKRP
jgi:hypothetical protein